MEILPRAGVRDVEDPTAKEPAASAAATESGQVAGVEADPGAGTWAVPGLLRAGDPSAGAVGLDLRLVEQGVTSFFARLVGQGGDGEGRYLNSGTATWLAAVAAAALQVARVRDRTRRGAQNPAGVPAPWSAPAGEVE
jgi:hypothetical protein